MNLFSIGMDVGTIYFFKLKFMLSLKIIFGIEKFQSLFKIPQKFLFESFKEFKFPISQKTLSEVGIKWWGALKNQLQKPSHINKKGNNKKRLELEVSEGIRKKKLHF